jgi:hypothetical protein
MNPTGEIITLEGFNDIGSVNTFIYLFILPLYSSSSIYGPAKKLKSSRLIGRH